MRKPLLAIGLLLLLGCAASTDPKPEGPPSPHDECIYRCLNVYSSCIIECDKTSEIGAPLDSCIEQCKEQWAQCKEKCSD